MKDRDFLIWILQRLHFVYGESLELDYMSKLASIIEDTSSEQLTPNVILTSRVRELLNANPR